MKCFVLNFGKNMQRKNNDPLHNEYSGSLEYLS